jgi:hypothetical protein
MSLTGPEQGLLRPALFVQQKCRPKGGAKRTAFYHKLPLGEVC